jgi:CheY-like chemotaxis protein
MPESTSASQHYKDLRVLVAEDNQSNQLVAAAMLQYIGCRIDLVSNGREAVEKVREVPYDILFMDCLMPVMNGFEATAEIRRLDNDRKNTVIIALTANAIKGFREKCLAAGMNDYLSKPVRTRELCEMMDRWVPSDRRCPGQKKEQMPTEDWQGYAGSVFDVARLKELCYIFRKSGKDIIPSIVEPFLKSMEESVLLLNENIDQRHYIGVGETAHRLKGSSNNLGLLKIARICSSLMENVQMEHHNDLKELVHSLETEIPLVRKQVDIMKEMGLC